MPKKKKVKKVKKAKKVKKGKITSKTKPSLIIEKKSSVPGPDEKPEIKKIKKIVDINENMIVFLVLIYFFP